MDLLEILLVVGLGSLRGSGYISQSLAAAFKLLMFFSIFTYKNLFGKMCILIL